MSADRPSHTLYLVDGTSQLYRAYFAMINNPLINSKGLNVSAISGFTNTLHEILTKYEPTHAAVVFDAPGKTDRAQEHEFYKANRQAAPEDLIKSIPYIKKIVTAFNIPSLEVSGYEADDLIGTIAKKAARKGFDVYMVTPDKDFAQLVEEHIFIHKPPYKGKGHEILDVAKIKEKWEVEDPLQVIDILGMFEEDPETEAIVTIGSKEGLAHLALATVERGDVVLVPNPSYPIHPYGFVIAGADIRHVPLVPGGDFFAELVKAIKDSYPKPKMLVLNFPGDRKSTRLNSSH